LGFRTVVNKSHGGGILNNLLDLLTKPLVPGVGPAPEIAAAVAALIRHIQQQSGKTTDQILADAEVTLDENEKMLLEDKIRLGG
jgi:hypothetical protein